MKTKIILLLSLLVLAVNVNVAYSKVNVNSELMKYINMYKIGNYTECYERLNTYVKKDPSNPLAYYYLAMASAQVGKKEEAISNYERVVSLTPASSKISRYSTKGKTCLESPDKCHDEETTIEDAWIYNKETFSNSVKGIHDKLKLENMQREINRSDDIAPQRFKEYKDYSSMNEVPTNEEIVNAIRVLQRAGIGVGSGENMTASNDYELLDMFNGTKSYNPQLMQTLLLNNMQMGL